MLKFLLSFTSFISLIQSQRTCDDFIQDQMGCIQQSSGTCRWNDNQNTCDVVSSYKLGCSNILNQLACQTQLTDGSGTRAYCRFGRTCQPALNLDLFLCTDTLSKYACLGINNQNISCIWNQMTYQCSNFPQVNATISNSTVSNSTTSNSTKSNSTSSNSTSQNSTSSNSTRSNSTITSNSTVSNLTISNSTRSNSTITSNSTVSNLTISNSTTPNTPATQTTQPPSSNPPGSNPLGSNTPGSNISGSNTPGSNTPGSNSTFLNSTKSNPPASNSSFTNSTVSNSTAQNLTISNYTASNSTTSNSTTIFVNNTIAQLNSTYQDQLIVLIQQSNPIVCSQVTAFACVHSIDSYQNVLQYLNSLYQSLSTQTSLIAYYHQLKYVAGCYMVNQTNSQVILQNLKCDATGLNAQACQMISTQGEQCAFIGNQCVRINAMSAQDQTSTLLGLSCQAGINKAACLSLIGGSGCYWDRNASLCSLLNVNYSTINCGDISINKITQLLSPSVCTLIAKAQQECFYIGTSTYTSSSCNQLCRSNKLQYKNSCKNSAFGCLYTTDSSGSMSCRFQSKSQCGLQGQNRASCMLAPEACLFQNYQCSSLDQPTLLFQLCTSGLNQYACLNLYNNYQTCYWDDLALTCNNLEINSNTSCLQVNNLNSNSVKVNPNSCKFISKEPCVYSASTQTCSVVYSNAQCTDPGVNKLACINNQNSNQYCQWLIKSASCRLISNQDRSNQGLSYLQLYGQCSQQLLVSQTVCTQIRTSGCTYDKINYNCVVPPQNNIDMYGVPITCDSIGINKVTCLSLSSLACRWSDICSTFTIAQGTSISCNSLQAVTPIVCTLISASDKCVYDSLFMRCKTSVVSNSACNTLGLNTQACQFLDENCYVNLISNKCTSVATSDSSTLNQLRCYENYPTQSVCLLITTPGQFCTWNSQVNQCQQVVYTSGDECSYFSLNINRNVCRGIHVNTALEVDSNDYCQIRSTTTNNFCDAVKSTLIFDECGAQIAYDTVTYNQIINIHSCVAQSNQNKACYFDLTQYVCTSIPVASLALDPAVTPALTPLSTISCMQGNEQVCQRITTPGQYCFWINGNNRCQNGTNIQATSVCSDSTQLSTIFSPNICAAFTAPGLQCGWFLVNGLTVCQDVSTKGSIYTCSQAGLNINACLLNTLPSSQCLFISQQCTTLVSGSTLAQTLLCSASVNQGGCLAILGQACQWSNSKCSQVKVTQMNTCSNFAGGTTAQAQGPPGQGGASSITYYNPITCAQIQGTACGYDSVSQGCVTKKNFIYCTIGYNQPNCPTNNCQWNQRTSLCLTSTSTKTQCSTYTTQSSCISQTVLCVWTGVACLSVLVSPQNACADFQIAGAAYSPQICQQITLAGESCYYSYFSPPATAGNCQSVGSLSINQGCSYYYFNQMACLASLVNKCTTLSLIILGQWDNVLGCIAVVGDFSTLPCNRAYNQYACTQITTYGQSCQFDITNNICGQVQQNGPQSCATVALFSFSSNYCQSNTQVACAYSSSSMQCQAATIVNSCDEANTLLFNSIACTLNTHLACQFNLNICSKMTSASLSALTCVGATSVGQCVLNTNPSQICQWVNNACQNVSPSTLTNSCASLTNVNPNVCMQQLGTSENCGWVYVSYKAYCKVVDFSALTSCAGLNQMACISASNNFACVYKSNQCSSVTGLVAAQTGCSDQVSESGCLAITQIGQYCYYNGGTCSMINPGMDATRACSDFQSNTYSQSVCSAVTKPNQACGYNSATYQCSSISSSVTCNTFANGGTIGLNLLSCTQFTSNSCYFDPSTNLCSAVSSGLSVTNIVCINLNQLACATLNIPNQRCQWLSNSCVSVNVASTDLCTTYGINFGPQVCASITSSGQSCMQDNQVYPACIQILNVNTLPCATSGLNQLGCLNTVIQACYFYQNTCQIASQAILSSTSCPSNVNQITCTSISGACCQWNTTLQICQSGSVSATQKCTDLVTMSPMCCASVISSGQACATSAALTCAVITTPTSCSAVGINKFGCLTQTTGNCQWLNNVCSSFQSPNLLCDQVGINKASCVGIQTIVNSVPVYCQWNSTSVSCQYIVVTPSMTCATLININSQYICSQVVPDGCYYDQRNNQCAVTSNITIKVPCLSLGLNYIGCLNSSDTCTWSSNQCNSQQQPFTATLLTSCSPLYSKGLCAQVTYSVTLQCFFNSTLLLCSNLATTPLTNTTQCATLSYLNNPSMCQNVTTQPCGYDLSSLSCIVKSGLASSLTCDVTKGQGGPNQKYYLNSLACLYVTTQNCSYNTTSNACAVTVAPNVTQSCTQYIQFAYCLQSTLNCQWVNYTCLDYTYGLQNCSSSPLLSLYVSQQVCTLYSIGSCKYDSINNLCVVNTNQTRVLCTDALNAYDCKYSVMNQNCYFDYLNTQTCLQLVTSRLSNYSCEQIRYSNNNLCTQITGEGQFCMLNVSSGNCIDVPLYTNTLCNSSISYQACLMLKTQGQQCQWVNSKCQLASNLSAINCQANINIHACTNIIATACIWRGQNCDYYQQGDSLSLISQLVCSAQNTQYGLRWNPSTYSCISPDVYNDNCTQPGLNMIGCYSLRSASCRWVNQQCVQFTDTTKTKCEQYVNVTSFSCAQISFASQLSCKYQNSSFCISSVPSKDICSTLGLNIIGCLNVQSQTCYFDVICKQQIILDQVTACMPTLGATQFLNNYSNALSCSSVNYLDQYCKYNQSRVPTCQPDFKTNTDTCTTPGLNLKACVSVNFVGASCSFTKSRCSFTNLNMTSCQNMLNANANSCNQLKDGEACKYGLIEQGCLRSAIQTPCQTQGLNQQGCSIISGGEASCNWYRDYQACSCNIEEQIELINSAPYPYLQSLINCSTLTNITCSLSQQCYYDGIQCKRQTCSNLRPDYCFGYNFFQYNGSSVRDSICYLDSQHKVCHGAQFCSDLIDLYSANQCDQFNINGIQCANAALIGSCRDKSCSDLTNITCLGQVNGQVCILSNTSKTCVDRSCSDLLQSDCFNITLKGQSCNWNNNRCNNYTICQGVESDLQFGDSNSDSAQDLCNSTIIGGRNCNWQQVDLISTQMECTINQCKIFGQSHSNCDGSEISKSVCQLVSNTCVPCELIPDVCVCKSSQGACGYSLALGCHSIPCDQFHSQLNCTAAALNNRCTWSTKLSQCLVPCQKLSRSQCKSRQDQQLCYYDLNKQSCINGQPIPISLNPLAYLQRTIYGAILSIMCHIMILTITSSFTQ